MACAMLAGFNISALSRVIFTTVIPRDSSSLTMREPIVPLPPKMAIFIASKCSFLQVEYNAALPPCIPTYHAFHEHVELLSFPNPVEEVFKRNKMPREPGHLS